MKETLANQDIDRKRASPTESAVMVDWAQGNTPEPVF